MSYYRICPNCGKGTVARYATDDSLCGECSDNSSTTDKLSVEKLQEELDFTKEYIKKSTEESKEHNDFLDRVIEAVKKLKSDNEIMKKALTEIDRSRYGMQFRKDRNPNVARQALAAIGGDDE